MSVDCYLLQDSRLAEKTQSSCTGGATRRILFQTGSLSNNSKFKSCFKSESMSGDFWIGAFRSESRNHTILVQQAQFIFLESGTVLCCFIYETKFPRNVNKTADVCTVHKDCSSRCANTPAKVFSDRFVCAQSRGKKRVNEDQYRWSTYHWPTVVFALVRTFTIRRC